MDLTQTGTTIVNDHSGVAGAGGIVLRGFGKAAITGAVFEASACPQIHFDQTGRACIGNRLIDCFLHGRGAGGSTWPQVAVLIDNTAGAFEDNEVTLRSTNATVDAIRIGADVRCYNLRAKWYSSSAIGLNVDPTAFVLGGGSSFIGGVQATFKLGAAHEGLICAGDIALVDDSATLTKTYCFQATDGTYNRATAGAAITAANFVLSAGWGDLASVTVIGGSKDERGAVIITCSGSGILANPTFQMNYNRAWPQNPFVQIQRTDNQNPNTALPKLNNESATQWTWQLIGTPQNGTSYRFVWSVRL